jgi:hypothetical protein
LAGGEGRNVISGENMKVIQQGDSWVIAKNFRNVERSGVSGTHSHAIENVRRVYQVWTGKEWYGQTAFALKFATKEEAEQYVDENRERLEQP